MIPKKKNIFKWAWCFLVFAFLFLWFSQVKPLTAYDGDDWLYLSYVRKAVPIWKDWNPARVLPEVLMPFCGAVAAYVLTPITGDYIGSITIVSALVVGGLVTAYVWCFDDLIKRVFQLQERVSMLVSVLFLLLHFLAFRGNESGNGYLFECWDLTCYYYYLIPALLNCSLVMYMMANPSYQKLLESDNYVKKGIFAMLIYFAIFSNLPSSVILAIYAGARILVEGVRNIRRFDWKAFLKSNAVNLTIVVVWLISAVFELSGARAQYDEMGYDLPLLEGLTATVKQFFRRVKGNNKAFLVFAAAVMIWTIASWILSKRKDENKQRLLPVMGEVLLCTVVMFLAVIILCMKVDYTYASRSEYVFGLYLYGFLILMMALSYLLLKYPKLVMALPVLLCILTAEVNTPGKTFVDSNLQYCDANVCKAVDNDIIQQIVDATRAGQTEMTLYVPVSGRTDNWPHSDIVGGRIAATLYEHGIIDQPIKVTTEPDMEMNEKHNVPVLGG